MAFDAVAPPTPRRRWWFSLRTLFVVVTILCVFLGWLAVQLKWIHDRREALQWILPLRERQLAAMNGRLPPPRKGVYVVHADVNVPWSLRIFGVLGVERLEVNQAWLNPSARYNLEEFRRLFPEAKIEVSTE